MLLVAAALLDDTVPNEAARALSPVVGWWLLVAAVALAAVFVLQGDRWRRWWLRMEDPRALAAFRIAFGIFVLANVNDLWEYFRFLFTDEGIFTADIARQVHAAGQFEGFGDGFGEDDPWGFYDRAAFLQFLEGPKYSLLYIWDSPTFFWWHLAAFELAGTMLVIGLFTRTAGILTFLLMNSILFRNHLFWEGTELVYRCFLAYLVCARSGHAYSVDNWLRCRRLRRAGRLSEPGLPGGGAGAPPSAEHPAGLEPIYRLVPAWPRRLMMLQLSAVYTTTGILKNGGIWTAGDAFYYALNLDHFYRFYPQPMSHYLGTNAFRLMTWVTHWWEVFFPVVVVGLVIRWAIYEKLPPLRGARRIATALAWIVCAAATGMVVHVTWPVHFTPFPQVWLLPLWGLAMALCGYGWWRLGERPFVIRTVGGRTLPEPIVVDREWLARWTMGRRLWLMLAVIFQLHVFVMMNIGQFQTGMLAANFAFLSGYEVALIFRAVGRRLPGWVPGIRADVRRGEPPVPPEDPAFRRHHFDTTRLPEWVTWGTLVLVVAVIVTRTQWTPPWPWTRLLWAPAGFLLLGGLWAWWKGRGAAPLPSHDDALGTSRLPWAYGPLGRLIVGSLLTWHVIAVAVWLAPDKDSMFAFRGPAKQIFSRWLTMTQTDQGWGMFAPNPPRSNVFMKVLVTDAAGEIWDMRTDVYAPERKPMPWIWNDRARKMNRRIIGGESGGGEWYRKWYARWQCREWELTHGGELPRRVELVKVWYQIPTPEQSRDLGWYVPEDLLRRSGHEQTVYTEECSSGIAAQSSPEVRARHGLPEKGPHVWRPWIKNKASKWERRRNRELARELGNDQGRERATGLRSAKPRADGDPKP
jgi:uncharacterized membrane protein YphA (DoxX/SURF4 family)